MAVLYIESGEEINYALARECFSLNFEGLTPLAPALQSVIFSGKVRRQAWKSSNMKGWRITA
jgi:hypothetical protein